MKEQQINNIKIRYNKMYGKWRTINPRGVVLEEFSKKSRAISFAKRTKDYVRR